MAMRKLIYRVIDVFLFNQANAHFCVHVHYFILKNGFCIALYVKDD